MGQPKEFKMPGKGKILMGKKTPVPMPKAKSGKPAPKGGKVIEKARSIVDVILPGKPGEVRQSMPSFLRKKKPVTRRGGK